ncbi:MAG: trypsin-like peptidase domain-containing protein [Tepidisphaerales bacterium]
MCRFLGVTAVASVVLAAGAAASAWGFWANPVHGGSGLVGLAVQASPTPPAAAPATRTQPFAAVKARADRVTKPIDAVVIWQQYIDSGVEGEDLEKAKAELQVWLERDADDAQLINRRWVGGAEKDRIVGEVKRLIDEGREMLNGGQALSAVGRFEQAAKLWPENFDVQFFLGYLALQKQDGDKALRHFEACNRIDPTNIEVLNNLAVGYFFKRQFERSITTFHRAAEFGDTRELAQNFLTALANSPEGLQRANRLKPARDAANLLARKYGISGPSNAFVYMLPGAAGRAGRESARREEEQRGVVGNGSGFIITADGLILTNKHVAGAGKSVMVKFNDGTQRTGEIVVLDDEQDLALVRVKTDEPLPFVRLAPYDNPADAAMAVVMGYPVTGMVGFSVKTTVGRVSSGNNAGMTSDVTLDVRVNPGNSGGPVYDQFGNVMAIVAQKTLSVSEAIDTYGLAISNGRIRKFLAKNNIQLEPGEETGQPLQPEEIAARNRMATVCILIVK